MRWLILYLVVAVPVAVLLWFCLKAGAIADDRDRHRVRSRHDPRGS